MKKYLIIVMSLLVVFGITFSAQALPVNYTFSGAITELRQDTSIATASGLNVGTSVSYTILVDSDLIGSKTNHGGTTTLINDTYFADYVSGSAIPPVNGGSNNDVNEARERNWAGRVLDANNNTQMAVLGSNDGIDFAVAGLIDTWSLGTTAIAFQRVTKATSGAIIGINVPGTLVTIHSTLTLTNIQGNSTPAPVPEPSTILLMGSGLVSFILYNKCKRKNTGQNYHKI